MNKKFSTLVASLLLAGALIMPMGAYAAASVPDGMDGTSIIANPTNIGTYFLTLTAGNKALTWSVGDNNTTSVDLEDATKADMWTIEPVSGGFYLKQVGGYLKIDVLENTPALASTPASLVGAITDSPTKFEVMTQSNSQVVIGAEVAAANGTIYVVYIKDGVLTLDASSGGTSIQATDGDEFFAGIAVAPEVEVTSGYSRLITGFANDKAARFLLTGDGEGLKIASATTTIDAADFSNIRIANAPAGEGYNLFVVDEDGEDPEGVTVSAGKELITGTGTSTTLFNFINIPDALMGSPLRYLSYSEGGKTYVLNTAGKFIEYNEVVLPGAVAMTVSEIAVPATVSLGDAYTSVAFDASQSSSSFLAVTVGGSLRFINGTPAVSTTPAEWTISPNTAVEGTVYLSIGGKSIYVDESAGTVSLGSSATALKLVQDATTSNYYITANGQYLTFDGTTIALEKTDVVKEVGRPVNPLAIKLCVSKADLPNFTEAQPNEKVTDFAAQAVGKYNYITFGKDFLVKADGTASTTASTMWKVSKVKEGLYSIANEEGEAVAFKEDGTMNKGGKYATFSYTEEGNLTYTDANGATWYVYVVGSAWKAMKTKPSTSVVFYVSTLSAENIDGQVKFLNGQLGNSFEMVFKDYNEDGDLAEIDVEANPFIKGEIVAVAGPKKVVVDADHEANPTDLSENMFLKVAGTYPLTNADATLKDQLNAFRSSTFIMVSASRYSSRINDVDDNNFFEYVTVKGSSLISRFGSTLDKTALATLAADEAKYKAAFAEGGKLYGVSNYAENAEFTVENYAKDSYGNPIYMKVAEMYALPTTSGKEQEAALEDYISVEDMYVAVKTYKKVNYVGAYKDFYDKVYFGTTNQVKQKDIVGIVNIISRNYQTNGKVYANGDESNVVKLDAKRVVLHNPEGQFYASATTKNAFTFKNRESERAAFTDVTLKKVPGKEHLYAVGNSAKDTVEIVPATVGNMYDGYANYDVKTQLENKTYNILVKSGVTGVNDVYLAENHKEDHTIGASADVKDAANWRLVKYTGAGDAEKLYNDTIYVIRDKAITYVENGSYKMKKDTIAQFVYALYNEANGEYLNYDAGVNHKAFYCDPEMVAGKVSGDAIRNEASKFILKEKNDGTYNLVVVNGNGRFDDATTEENYGKFSMSNEKAYIGVNDAKLNKESSIYKISDNDLFRIEEVDAPKYRSVATFDTIRIFKNDNEKIALYERGSFLGMQHTADITNMAPAMFADTAYVSNTNKPQYLLVVEPNLIWHNADCNIPGHPAVSPTAVDTVKGRFLVNMIDSLNAWGSKHDNPYEWETYPKLAFVQGAHTANKLIIDRVNPTAADVIDLSRNVDKIGTFAFRYVDRSQGSFVMETGTKDAKGNAGTGYIKWLNGTPVVVPSLALAEVFNLNKIAEAPTSNDQIGTSEVSIIAGVGSVAVKNAAGKTVSISNILGQTIVNTILTSDNASISVPSGIVVVAVEGEEAVKTVVR